MTAEQKVKWLIIKESKPELTYPYERIDELWERFDEWSADLLDATDAVRVSGIPTGLESEYSRNYDSEAVAARLPDGSWVGWTYWSGGGKHGNPEDIDWISEAYDVVCKETFRLCSVLDFSTPVIAAK